jgi:hypothetical protein
MAAQGKIMSKISGAAEMRFMNDRGLLKQG